MSQPTIATGLEKALIQNYESWDEADYLVIQYNEATLTDQLARKLGVNSPVSALAIDYDQGRIQVYDEEGKTLGQCNFDLKILD